MNYLYMMMGYPGAGKTTSAKIIAELTGAVHLSSDKARFDIFGKPEFTDAEHETLYKELDKQTEALLNEGKSVIYDANLNRYAHRKDKYDICERTDSKPVLVWVQTPKELAKERAVHAERQHLIPHNETADQMFDRIAQIIEPPHDDEHFIALDGTKISQDYVLKALDL